MYISYAARAYWRMIKIGNFNYADIKSQDIKDQVKYLAKLDVESGEITEADYLALIGEEYTPITEA